MARWFVFTMCRSSLNVAFKVCDHMTNKIFLLATCLQVLIQVCFSVTVTMQATTELLFVGCRVLCAKGVGATSSEGFRIAQNVGFNQPNPRESENSG